MKHHVWHHVWLICVGAYLSVDTQVAGASQQLRALLPCSCTRDMHSTPAHRARTLCTSAHSRRGVTLICGGGFHGKTTLLKAIEAGVYNKVRLC